MSRDLSNLRRQFNSPDTLLQTDLSDDPLKQFAIWFDQVLKEKQIQDPNAMTLSTLDLDGHPRSRVVLLKSFDDNGFVFYTNYLSNKGKAISSNPKVCISFYWPVLNRQVIIKGIANKIAPKISDAYFKSRPHESQIAAILSQQSTVIHSRVLLERKFDELKSKYELMSPKRPADWGGYVVNPLEYEFWQGQVNRLHDRFRYSNDGQNWKIDRLSP